MTTTETQAWAALHNLVTQARKANDLRYAAHHRSINAVLDGMEELTWTRSS